MPHPVTAEGMTVREVAAGTALDELIGGNGWVAVVNGRPAPPGEWSRPLPDGAVAVARAAVEGNDSDPVRAVLQVAALAASLYVPGALGLQGLALAGAQAAMTIGGQMLVNAIVPPDVDLPSAGGPNRGDPSYSLSGGANRSRPHEPMMLVLGFHRVHPDLGAAPYSTFESRAAPGAVSGQWDAPPEELTDGGDEADEGDGDGTGQESTNPDHDLPRYVIGHRRRADRSIDHYLHQIFHFGLGRLTIENLRIGETPVEQLDGAETETAGADGRISLVYGNIDTAPGAEIADTNPVIRRTSPNATRASLDFVGRIHRFADDGAVQVESVGIVVRLRPVGTETWKVHRLALGHGDLEPYRLSVAYDLDPAGEWEVSVARAEAPSSEDRVSDDVTWAALRSHQPDGADYAGQNRVALRVRASEQAHGRLDAVSADVQQLIPTWDGSSWVDGQATSNPAWIYRWYARGVFIGGRLAAGVGLDADRIDDDAIKAWGAWCDDRGLGCNAVLEGSEAHGDVLTMIARCGRASPTWATGKLGAVWDAAGQPPQAYFGPGNIVAGSMEVAWADATAADEVICRYIDPELDWQPATVRRNALGVAGTANRPVSINLRGVTSRAQAIEECNLQAARQRHHRRRLSWRTGPEGLAVSRGMVANVCHSLIDGGITGRVLSVAGDAVTLSRPVMPADRTPVFDAPVGNDVIYRAAGAPTFDYVGMYIEGTDFTEGSDQLPGDHVSAGEGRFSWLRINRGADATRRGSLVVVLDESSRQGGSPSELRDEDDLAWLVRFSDDGGFRRIIYAPLRGKTDDYTYFLGDLAAIDPPQDANMWAVQYWARGTRAPRGAHVELLLVRTDGGFDARTLSVPSDQATGGTRLLMRLPNGSMHSALPIRHPDDAALEGPVKRVVLKPPLPASIQPGDDPLDVLWHFYPDDAPPARVKIASVEPAADGTVGIEAIDEVPEYYAAAALALDAALPAVRSRRPAVSLVDLGYRRVRIDGGYVVEVTASIIVRGDWRGGVVLASHDGAAERTVARLGPGEAEATWITPSSGRLSVRVVPGSIAAPAGSIATAALDIPVDAFGTMPDPVGVSVLSLPTGYEASWDKPGDTDYAGTEVWDDNQGDGTAADPPSTAIRRATVSASSYTRLAAGTSPLRIWVRHLDVLGRPGAYAAANVTPASPNDGRDGRSFEWQGKWSNARGVTYRANATTIDIVRHDGGSYVCRREHTSPPAREPGTASGAAYWSTLAEDGNDGEDALGWEYVYAVTNSDDDVPSPLPGNNWAFDRTNMPAPWHDDAPSLTSANKVLWECKRRVVGTPARDAPRPPATAPEAKRWSDWSAPSISGRYGDHGEDGDDGVDGIDGIDGDDGNDGEDALGWEYVYAVTDSDDDVPSPLPGNNWAFDRTNMPAPWHDDAPSLTSANKVLWECKRRVVGTPARDAPRPPATAPEAKRWSDWSAPSISGRYGDKGDKGDKGEAAISADGAQAVNLGDGTHYPTSKTARVRWSRAGSVIRDQSITIDIHRNGLRFSGSLNNGVTVVYDQTHAESVASGIRAATYSYRNVRTTITAFNVVKLFAPPTGPLDDPPGNT